MGRVSLSWVSSIDSEDSAAVYRDLRENGIEILLSWESVCYTQM